MAFHHAAVRNTITTSIAILIVVLALAFSPSVIWSDLLGVTAEHTAVLVVFIGTITSGLVSIEDSAN